MATQALISSSSITASAEASRQIFGARSFQSAPRKVSFVVRAGSSPPVKVNCLSKNSKWKKKKVCFLNPSEIDSLQKLRMKEVTDFCSKERIDNCGLHPNRAFLIWMAGTI